MKYYTRNKDLYYYGKYKVSEFIAKELLTEKELEDIETKTNGKVDTIKKYFTIVDIPKSKTYTSFGIRFEIKKGDTQ
jgi:hypothetical protein